MTGGRDFCLAAPGVRAAGLDFRLMKWLSVKPKHLGLAGLVMLAGGLVLLPWWRHHSYIRDFYDYGLVIAGVGRIAGGERP